MLTFEQSVKNLDQLITHCLGIGVFKKKEDLFLIHESLETIKKSADNGSDAKQSGPGFEHINKGVAGHRNNRDHNSRKKKEKT